MKIYSQVNLLAPMNFSRDRSALFFSKEESDRDAFEIKVFPKLVFEIVFIRLFYIIGEIAEECKGRNSSWQLGNILDLYRMSSYHRWMV